MKLFILILLSFIFINKACSQAIIEIEIGSGRTAPKVDVKGTYAEKDTAWRKNVINHINTSKFIRKGAKKGTYIVIVNFIVDKDGVISDVECVNDPGHEMGAEAVRAIKGSSKWLPGPVRPMKSTYSYQILDDSKKVRLDGLYQTKSYIDKEDNDTTCSYLRFYYDGRVINVTAEGTASDLQDWFNLKMDNPSIGYFRVHRKRIYFSTTSKEGTVNYKGKIKNQYRMILKSKSLITGYKIREKYYFVALPGLK